MRHGRTRRRLGLALALSAALAGVPAGDGGTGRAAEPGLSQWAEPAGASMWVEGLAAKLRLVAAATTVSGPALAAGVEIVLEPGWKTYWRVPGDSGVAPSFDFSGSENVAAVDVAYPVPQRFDAPGDITFGYTGRVVFPLTVTPADPGRPVVLDGRIVYGVCEALCVPVESHARLAWETGPPEATPFSAVLEDWAGRVPREGILSVDAVEAVAGEDGGSLRLSLAVPGPLDAPYLIVEPVAGPARVVLGVPEVMVAGSRVDAAIPVHARRNAPGLEAGGRFELILADRGRAYSAIAVLPPASAPGAPQRD